MVTITEITEVKKAKKAMPIATHSVVCFLFGFLESSIAVFFSQLNITVSRKPKYIRYHKTILADCG
jgi:hypothetical protein